MKISDSEIESKKEVGKSGSSKVIAIKTIGGLHLVAKVTQGGKSEILAAAPHRAIARHIASKTDENITWTELSKSEHVPVSAFEHLLPEYQALTDQIRKLQGY